MKKTEKKAQQTLVYCGPEIPFVAKRYESYTGGLPERLMEVVTAVPAVSALIVPAEQLAETRAALLEPGSALWNIFRHAAEEIKGREW